MRSTLARRLLLGSALILLLVIGTLAYFIISHTRAHLSELAQERHEALTALLARSSLDGLAARDFELLDGLLQALSDNHEIAWAAIADRHGTILAATRANWIGQNDEKVLRGTASTPAEKGVRVVHRPAVIDGVVLGEAWIGYRTDLDPFKGHLPGFIGAAAAVALLMLFLAIAALVRHQTRPLEELSNALATIHLDTLPEPGSISRLAGDGSIEVVTLTQEFELLVQRLREARAAIAREEERLQQAVEARTAELRAINEELESFSYSVSHDLRAPLRAIDGFSQALVEECADQLDKESLDYLQRIRRASQRMGNLIDSLLRLSRITRSELRLQDTNLSALAREILSLLAQQEPGRSVEWIVDDDLHCYCDPELMQIALDNLLSNAWKFTRDRHPARIEVRGKRTSAGLELCVEDNGIGFDMRQADRLFGAFQRLHAEKDYEGSGIGLATVQRIVHRHHGSIRALAEPGKGARFCLLLPESSPAGLPAPENGDQATRA